VVAVVVPACCCCVMAGAAGEGEGDAANTAATGADNSSAWLLLPLPPSPLPPVMRLLICLINVCSAAGCGRWERERHGALRWEVGKGTVVPV